MSSSETVHSYHWTAWSQWLALKVPGFGWRNPVASEQVTFSAIPGTKDARRIFPIISTTSIPKQACVHHHEDHSKPADSRESFWYRLSSSRVNFPRRFTLFGDGE
ncbi:hypothetical protein RAA17_08935 [Komagataeibacter rhaeticus]|nr:hypothetical protein [Komagataeibacter rhaeticus]